MMGKHNSSDINDGKLFDGRAAKLMLQDLRLSSDAPKSYSVLNL